MRTDPLITIFVTSAFLRAMREFGITEHPGGKCPAPSCPCEALADAVEARAREILGIGVPAPAFGDGP